MFADACHVSCQILICHHFPSHLPQLCSHSSTIWPATRVVSHLCIMKHLCRNHSYRLVEFRICNIVEQIQITEVFYDISHYSSEWSFSCDPVNVARMCCCSVNVDCVVVAGGEALVSCGMMEALLKIVNWYGEGQEHITVCWQYQNNSTAGINYRNSEQINRWKIIRGFQEYW